MKDDSNSVHLILLIKVGTLIQPTAKLAVVAYPDQIVETIQRLARIGYKASRGINNIKRKINDQLGSLCFEKRDERMGRNSQFTSHTISACLIGMKKRESMPQIIGSNRKRMRTTIAYWKTALSLTFARHLNSKRITLNRRSTFRLTS